MNSQTNSSEWAGVRFGAYDAGMIGRASDILQNSLFPETRDKFMQALALEGADVTLADHATRRAVSLWIMQRWNIRQPYERDKIAKQIAQIENEVLCDIYDQQDGDAVFDTVADLEETGLSLAGQILSPDQCEEVASFISARPTSSIGGGATDFDTETIVNAPHLLEVALHPKVIGVATQYLGAPATLIGLTLRLSSSRDVPAASGGYSQEAFHRDYFDFRSCGLYLYLSDVSENSGPHLFVERSHTLQSLTAGAPNAKQGDIARLFLTDPVPKVNVENSAGHLYKTIMGKAGAAFWEDIYGLHRATPVISGTRLLFRATYGLVTYPRWPLVLGKSNLSALPSRIPNTPLNKHAARFLLPA